MKIIEVNIMQIIMNQNGNHIIQKILEIFEKETTEFISRLILKNVKYKFIQIEKLSFHSFGCRVVQKYL